MIWLELGFGILVKATSALAVESIPPPFPARVTRSLGVPVYNVVLTLLSNLPVL